jgi:hypothetical protein
MMARACSPDKWVRSLLAVLAASAFLACGDGAETRLPLPTVDPDLRAELTAWIRDSGASPPDYVLSKFADHDVVLLGEYHRIRHDPLLVQELIPRLPAVGVHLLGIEFANAADQPLIDSLLSGPRYDEALARRIQWNQWPFWGFREYVDLYRVAWEVNRSLPDTARRFRILGLNARTDWSHVWTPEDREDPEIMARVWPDGDSDAVMAETILREVVAEGEKALIYSGINHAYTRFHQPIYDAERGELVDSITNRMGNRVYREIGDRAFVIYLHAPWPAAAGYQAPGVYPADGVIDAVFATLPPGERRVGFDVVDSPFGDLPAASSYWGHANPDFRLRDYCDGWIFQRPLSAYEGVHVIDGWFTADNRLAAIGQIANPDPRVKDTTKTVADLEASLASDTDFARRFARFH